MGVERYCGRVIDFTTATYFPATERFAKICDCGRGHFQIPPKAERAEFKRQNTIAQRLASEGICDEQEHYT